MLLVYTFYYLENCFSFFFGLCYFISSFSDRCIYIRYFFFVSKIIKALIPLVRVRKEDLKKTATTNLSRDIWPPSRQSPFCIEASLKFLTGSMSSTAHFKGNVNSQNKEELSPERITIILNFQNRLCVSTLKI